MSEPNHQHKLTLDFRWVAAALFLIIAIMIMLWQPWLGPQSDTRTIEVTGDATITATPDEFVFYPTYQFENSNKSTALTALSSKSGEIVAQLKTLGVPENKIKTSSTGYDLPAATKTQDVTTYTLQLTITVAEQELAEKVQNYLLTTAPTGSVSPQPTFSESKRKELEKTGRDAAVNDAKAKAIATAKNLGFHLGRVKTVSDGSGFGYVPYESKITTPTDNSATQPQLNLYPGENSLPYRVTVTYFVR
ncbi:MAG TPA: SIMPL domain-containing protein [Candidatus Saccharimonadales bacterium]|nr:SIMPL domain-containing protein [Candidatus Saccharimonadales bacterium]